MEVKKVLKMLLQLRKGSFKITRQKFRNALKRSIGANKEYADGCWGSFLDSPLHYICSRSSDKQGEELIRVCMKLGK
jgi:hypothetical protein